MRIVNIIRDAVGISLLICALEACVTVLAGYAGVGRLSEMLGRFVLPCYMLMIPLGLLHALLALPGGTSWRKRLLRSLVMKLLLIPFFLVNFLYGFAGMLLFFLPGSIVLTLLAALIAWMTLLSTSVDVIRALIIMRREGRMTTGKMAKHIIFQLIYCIDLVDVIVLWLNRDRYVPSAGTKL